MRHDSVPRAVRPVWTLERRVPLTASALLTIFVLFTIGFSWWEVRQSGVAAATSRIATSSRRLAELLGAGPNQNLAEFNALGSSRPIQTVLATRSTTDSAAAALALRPLMTAADTTMPVQLWSDNGQLVVSVAGDRFPGNVPPPIREDSLPEGVVYGPIFVEVDSLRFWRAAPVRSDGRVAGYITHLQRLVTGGGSQLEDIIGEGVAVYMTSRGNNVRFTLDGEIDSVPPGFVTADSSTFAYDDPVHGPQLAHVEAVPATMWLVTVEIPMAVISAGADRFLRRATVFGAILIVAGTTLSWRISRSLTAPLKDLRSAAVAIGSGDYSHRVRVRRPDELGDVANMFNTMADHIQATHDALAERFEEAQLLTEELEQSMAEADASREVAIAANNAKAEFLATMSHEIRTPINAVLGYADLLEIGAASPLNPDQRRYVERIKVSGSLLAGLVNDVLDFAKIESGRMRVDNVITPVQDVVKAAFAVIEPYAVSRDITLVSSCDDNLQFCGDRKRAEQVLLNLLSNGVKFSRTGGQIAVTCRAARRAPEGVDGAGDNGSGWVCISVKDEGVGIRPDHMPHIFEPFMQGETGYTRKHGGTGLGLSISRKLARMMNGGVTFESTLGAGSTFMLWLPRELNPAPVLWPIGIT